MGIFSNPVVGGIGTLIRDFIQSVNFVTGISGWRISRNGDVEFNAGTFRGVITSGGLFIYAGPPVFGNLIAAIAPLAGVDPYGNSYGQGLSSASNGLGLTFNDYHAVLGGLFETRLGISSIHQLTIRSPSDSLGNTAEIRLSGDSAVIGSETFGFGAGVDGLYYAEELLFPQITILNATDTNYLCPAAGRVNSNYGSAYNAVTGQWIAPADGWYSFTIPIGFTTNPVANGRLRITVSSGALATGTIYYRDTLPFLAGVPLEHIWGFRRFFNKNDTVFITVNQNSTASLTTVATYNNHLTMAREL